MNANPPTTIDAYIAGFPDEVQRILTEVRKTVRQAAPDAEESISYGMPTYKLRGKPLVYFAAFKNHLGFYATPTGHAAFKEELARYKQGKGSVQFPLNEPMPLELMGRMVAFRVRENADRSRSKAK